MESYKPFNFLLYTSARLLIPCKSPHSQIIRKSYISNLKKNESKFEH